MKSGHAKMHLFYLLKPSAIYAIITTTRHSRRVIRQGNVNQKNMYLPTNPNPTLNVYSREAFLLILIDLDPTLPITTRFIPAFTSRQLSLSSTLGAFLI